MPIKKVLIILNILGLVGSLIWVVTDPGWEPVVTIVGLIATLIAQLFNAGDGGNRVKMSQKGGKGSTNYQSKGDITITNNPTTINHYGSTETMWIGQAKKSLITDNNVNIDNLDYFLELVEPVFLTKQDEYLTCLPNTTYKIDFLVNYKSKTETKFFANILPDAENYLFHHLAHKDNVKYLGKPLIGYGNIKFHLTGTAPEEPGAFERQVNIGLLNFKDWINSEILFSKFYKFNLIVLSSDKNKGPYGETVVNQKTGVSFMRINKHSNEPPAQS